MKAVIHIGQILEEWDETSEAMVNATRKRDYRQFRRCFSKGTRLFNSVKEFLNQNIVNESQLKAKIKETVSTWVRTTDGLLIWKAEIGLELENLKSKRKKKSKIRKGYSSHIKTTGLNVSRKSK